MAALSVWAVSWSAVIWMVSISYAQNSNANFPSINGHGNFVVGEEKSLTCFIVVPLSQASTSLQWSKVGVGNLLSTALDPLTHVSLVTIRRQYKFTVQVSDNGGRYRCTANLPSGPVYTDWVVYVYRAPDQPVLAGPSSVQVGTSGTWTCVVAGAFRETPIVDWLKSGIPVASTLFSNAETVYNDTATSTVRSNVTSTLTMPISQGTSSFTLTCRAVQHVANTKRNSSISVNVVYAPVVTVSGTGEIATTGSQITLDCSASATPAVTSVTWYKDGVPVNMADSRFSGATPALPSLTIVQVQRTDAGDYVCGATNSIGSSNSSVVPLVVRYRPIITYGQNPVGGVVNSDLQVVCLIDAYPTHTTVFWYRVSTTGSKALINSAANPAKYSGGTASTPSLTIRALASSDEGLYQCAADNDVDRGYGANVRVEIHYPPDTPTVTVNTSGYLEGDPIYLTCQSSGYPAPEYKWYRVGDGQEVGGGQTLTFASAGPGHAGVYRCQVSNTVGNVSAQVTVVVYYRPRAGAVSNVTATLQETVTLNCATDANPRPTAYTWTKGGVTVDGGSSSSSQLTVTMSSGDDFGRYDCVATNLYGPSDPIQVFVQQDGATGQSTEDTGLSTATLILIVIICIIILIVIILIVIFCCTTGRCRCQKKDNNVSPSVISHPPPPLLPADDKPLAPIAASPNGHVASGKPPASSAYRSPRNGVGMGVDLGDGAGDHTHPSSHRNGTASLGHGLSISLPGELTPKPHHLPPLGQDGVPEETESARPDKPRKKKRTKRHDRHAGSRGSEPEPDLKV
ncbi:B-cell receptor CD22-like [Babylonia areolata]|uniref:B-cell receptor CD22-like n=1 Tax=Babylonia areolata TaxID=304850 RepID=UPI003FD2B65F